MFKIKNFLTPITTMCLYFNRKTTIYTNTLTPNNVSISYTFSGIFIPIQFLTDFYWTTAVDICAFNNKNISKISHNNLFYNYKFDIYINNITKNYSCDSNSLFFFNRLWLEREVTEMFNVNYLGIRDTRPLLLNYGDVTGVLLSNTQVQTVSEIKTNWHSRKLFKNSNVNINL